MRRGIPYLFLVPFLTAACQAGAGPTASPATPAPTPAPTTVPASPNEPSPTDAGSPDVSPAPTVARVVWIGSVAWGPDGTVYSTDCGQGVVYRLTSPTTATPVVDGHVVTDDAFGDGGPALEGQVICPSDVDFDPQGRLLIVDHGHNRIRRIEVDGTITTIVGAKSPPYVNRGDFSGDGGPAVDAALNAPTFLTVAPDGTLYFGDRENDRFRFVTPDGIIRTLAGNGDEAFGGDGGPAVDAGIDFPLGTAVDVDGNVYLADDNHNRVRMVAPDGTITTVIGDGSFASGGDGGPAAKAQLNDPQGLAIDPDGNLYIAETGGNRIRRIDPTGIVTTIAGTGGDSADKVDVPASEGDLPGPTGLTIGPDGALYTDDALGRLLRIDLETGLLTVVYGGPDHIALE